MADNFCISLGCPGGGGFAWKQLMEEPSTYKLVDEKKKDDDEEYYPHSKKKEKKEKQQEQQQKQHDVTHLPILIIPGFMSSGLEIKESQTRPDWVGKRIWLNLSSLGLSAMYFGSAQEQPKEQATPAARNDNTSSEDEQQQQQQHNYKSQWLNHMRLHEKNLCSDPMGGGIRVRPIQGLEGVDYLTPGTFTNHVSYVFGPVIEVLKKDGKYKEGINLQAAPYDWRLPPLELEKRDRYFSGLIKQVEELYRNNYGTPVVLLGHSLGTKTAHYFLNFALRHKGQAWLDRYVHTYLPVGAPHLGAPKALRSVVVGDKMSLDAFLNDEEALALGRSFGSGPWLFPKELPRGVPSSVYVLPHGVLEISFVSPLNTYDLVKRRTAMSKPNRYKVVVSYGNNGDRMLHTPLTDTDNNCNDHQVTFNDKISFATHPDASHASNYGKLRVYLLEPGIAVAKEEVQENSLCCILWTPICCLLRWITCCCIFDYLYRFIRWILCGVLFRGVALSADAITSGAGGGTNLALSNPIVLPSEVWNGEVVTKQIPLFHKDDYSNPYEQILCFYFGKNPRTASLRVQFRWIPYDDRERSKSFSACSPVCQPNLNKNEGTNPQQQQQQQQSALDIVSAKKEQYQEFAGHDILEREGLEGTLQLIKGVYDADATVGPRSLSSLEAPPVQRIHAIYGININTEIGGVYRRKDRCLSENQLKNLYKLDSKASIATKSSGYSLQGGLLYETRKTKQADGREVSGDGTVPYWSLTHCKTWKTKGRDVSVIELDNAEHREILADPRFHKALLDYCRIRKETV